MARSRVLKAEFFQHDGLGELSPVHRLLFAGLWTLADREGRLVDRPIRIAAALFPYDRALDVDALLNDLAAHREHFIRRYSVENERYIEISKFVLHQRPHPHEAKSTIPPPSAQNAVTCNDKSGHVRKRRDKSRNVRPVSGSSSSSSSSTSTSASTSASASENTDPSKTQDLHVRASRDVPERWLTPFGSAYQERFGGEVERWPLLAKVVAPVVAGIEQREGLPHEMARAAALLRWTNFLGSLDPTRPADLHVFTRSHGQFTEARPFRPLRTVRSAGEQNNDALERVRQRIVAKEGP